MSKTEKIPISLGEKYDFKEEYDCPYCHEKFKSHYILERHINLLHPFAYKDVPLRGDNI